MIYLDHNATTPVDSRVKKAIQSALDVFGNPSSVHIYGRKARQLLEESRQKVAELIGANPEEIIFTSGGTEANNLALLGYALNFKGGHVIASAIEHPSVLNTLRFLQSLGYEVTLVKPTAEGVVEPDEVLKAIKDNTILVSIMHSNNETGVLQPVREIVKRVKEHGPAVHCDAAQSIGRVEVDVDELGVDMLTVVSHKFHGPKGIGALYKRASLKLTPILYGGGQQGGIRPGTEPLPLIAGLAKASELAQTELPQRRTHLGRITSLLWDQLQQKIQGIELVGATAPRLPNTLNVCIDGIRGWELVSELASEVAISSGAACHAGTTEGSYVLLSMGLSHQQAVSSVRISTGKDNTPEEISQAAEIIASRVARLRKGGSR